MADSRRVGVRGSEYGTIDEAQAGMQVEARQRQWIRPDAQASGDAALLGLDDSSNERCDRLDPLLRTDATGWDQATLSKAAGAGASSSGWLDDADDARPQGRRERRYGGREWSAGSASLDAWQHHGWVMCADGRARQAAPIARRMDDGISARVGLLRGFGNAIVPQVAATFLQALAG
jgi:DNA (cytosine-5)-methyltransferase 1